MKWQPKHSSLLVIIIGFASLYLFYKKQWMLVPVAVALLGYLINQLGSFIHAGWMLLAKVLGYINSRILLTILFFIVLTPLALVMRLFKKSEFRSVKKTNTVFVTRNHLYTKKDLSNPW